MSVALTEPKNKQPVLYIQGPPGSGKSRALARETVRLVLKEGLASDYIRIIVQQASDIEPMETALSEEAQLLGKVLPPVTIQTWHTFLLKLIRLYADKVPLVTLGDSATLPHQVSKINRHQALLILQTQVVKAVEAGLLPSAFSASDSFVSDLYSWILSETYQVAGLLQKVSMPSQYTQIFKQLSAEFIKAIHAQGLLTSYDIVRMGHQLIRDLTDKDHADLLEVTLSDIQTLLVDDTQWMEQDDLETLLLLSQSKQLVLASSSVYPSVLPPSDTLTVTSDVLTSVHRGNESVLWWLSEWQKKTTQCPFWEIHESGTTEAKTSIAERVQFISGTDDINEAEQMANALLNYRRQGMGWQNMTVLVSSQSAKTMVRDMLVARKIPVAGEQDLTEPVSAMVQHFVVDAFRVLEFLVQNPAIAAHRLFSQTGLKNKLDEPDKFTDRRHASWYFNRMLSVVEASFEDDLSDEEKTLRAKQQLIQWFSLVKKVIINPETDDDNNVLSAQFWKLLALTDFFEMAQHNPDQDRAMQVLSGFYRQLKALEETKTDANTVLHYVNHHFALLWPQSPSNQDNHLALYEGVKVVQANLKTTRSLSLNQPEVLVVFGMTEGLYPVLLPEVQSLGETFTQLHSHLCSELRFFVSLLVQATKRVVLTTSELKNGKPVTPSLFYRELKQEYDQLFLDKQTEEKDLASLSILEKPPERLYEAQSVWSQLPLPPEVKQIYADPNGHPEPLSLSASAINTYMKCPRQFYYGNVLKLPQDSSDAANAGLLMHLVMEVYNKTIAAKEALPVEDHAGALKTMVTQWFDFARVRLEKSFSVSQTQPNLESIEESREALLQALDTILLPEKYYYPLLKLDMVGLEALFKKIIQTLDDMDFRGYFKQYGKATVLAEKRLSGFSVEGIQHATFNGMLDALIEKEPGRWVLMDYKHYGNNKFKAAINTCQKNFTEGMLSRLPAEAADHETLFSLRLKQDYPADYQLLLYYLAMQNQDDFDGEIKELCLQILRPTFEDDAAKGSLALTLDVDELKKTLPDLVSDINNFIVTPIYQAAMFDKNAGTACKYCSYTSVCDVGDVEDGDASGGSES